jgi:diguanylate cyclase (GGDEF)-like protein
VRPLETLHEAAEQLRRGDLDYRVSLPARCASTEVGQLASAFNAMAATLDETHRNLSRLASHDVLTGLANRAEFQVWLEHHLAARRGGDPDVVSVLFVDVDDFKDVNDSLGHAAGDALLIEVARRLRQCVRSNDMAARLGGDEFALLLIDRSVEGSSADAVAERVIAAVASPFVLADAVMNVTVSIGVSIAAADCPDHETLLAQADYAMYTSKRQGKGRATVFEGVARGQAPTGS